MGEKIKFSFLSFGLENLDEQKDVYAKSIKCKSKCMIHTEFIQLLKIFEYESSTEIVSWTEKNGKNT